MPEAWRAKSINDQWNSTVHYGKSGAASSKACHTRGLAVGLPICERLANDLPVNDLSYESYG